jgi:hypothetical protein
MLDGAGGALDEAISVKVGNGAAIVWAMEEA